MDMNNTSSPFPSWIALWNELRQRIIYWLSFFIIIFIISLPISNHIFELFAKPLLKNLPIEQPIIATAITTAFWVPIELCFWLSALLSIPFLLWQLWSFALPALKKNEKRWLKFYLSSSLGLFLAGLAFCYFVVLPVGLHILINTAPERVKVMPDIVNYLNFCFRLLLAFGLAWQLPLLMILLNQLQIVTIQQFKKIRRFVIIGAFVIGMLLAPDVISQCLLALPLWLLFEVGIVLMQ